MRFALLRQDRSIVNGTSLDFSSVKVSFHPIRHPDGRPIVFHTETGEQALAEARRLYPELREILLAVEPYSEMIHNGNPSRRIQ